jgi:hypothetical protein
MRLAAMASRDPAYVRAFYAPGTMPLYLNLDVSGLHARVKKLNQRRIKAEIVLGTLEATRLHSPYVIASISMSVLSTYTNKPIVGPALPSPR